MLSLVYIIAFIFCLAMAIAGIWIVLDAINTYNTYFHKNYFYYLLTFYAFAFYGIWGQIIMRALLSIIDANNDMIVMAANFLPILGIPFLGVSWFMLLKMGYSLTDVQLKRKREIAHVLLLAGLFFIVVGLSTVFIKKDWLIGRTLPMTLASGMLFLEFVTILIFSILTFRNTDKYKKRKEKVLRVFVIYFLVGFLLRVAIVPFFFYNEWSAAPILLLYFLSNFFPLFYLKLNSEMVFIPVFAGHPNHRKKELLYEKYGITKREREVVDAICEGKTNQQIADELFISLQTVKDHTHRIYSKIGINNRMKLVQLVNG